ncbi:amidohydrolase family protein [Parvibaculum sedimenti]|uniref:Dihydroorotase n=1 Tax=Parvibaculum sedimenti TaxID=2608632 RepID=A0A6N6VI78_9HYPH|nr:dihydroorotase [Parvibaculum sedimenti]KAB7740189.1 amidohydrolase family protein [Parvibaculum sedimenti]
MSRTAFINARLVDPASGLDVKGNLLVADGKIADLGPDLFSDGIPDGAEIVDCRGHILSPGLIDCRVFTGEPGAEHRETLRTASLAAAAGGVTTLIVMPNTHPVIDDVALVDFIERRARDTGIVHIHPMAALTKGLAGAEMTEIGLLKEAGAVAFTDGDRAVANAQVMRRAMSYAGLFGALIVQHAEVPELATGVMNDSELASRLGLSGIPAIAETIMIERDLRLLETTGGRYHVAQVSCAASVEIIRRARHNGLNVTCGVSAAHLALNENDIRGYRTFFKVSPPLRSEEDRKALVAGVADGTIDVIVSGHNPQDADAKRHPFAEASFGAIGLETLLPASLALVHDGDVPLTRLLGALTFAPADLLGLQTGRLAAGLPADLVLIDMGMPWVVESARLRSTSKNTPFEDRRVQGRALRTMVGGRTVYIHGDGGH